MATQPSEKEANLDIVKNVIKLITYIEKSGDSYTDFTAPYMDPYKYDGHYYYEGGEYGEPGWYSIPPQPAI
jgi:hypothetical protein